MFEVDVVSMIQPAALVAGAVTLAPSMIGYTYRKIVHLMLGR